MIIEDENYKIWYDNEKNTVFFDGSLRLWDPTGYVKIRKMLRDLYSLDTPALLLDFRELKFLNSSGISMLCKFIFEAKDLGQKPIKIIGNQEVRWQIKSFENLKKLWSKIELEFL